MLGDEQFAVADQWEKAAGWPGRIGVEPGLSDVSPAMPPITCSPRSTSSGPATAPTSLSTATSSRHRSHLDHDRRMPEPAADLGRRARMVRHATL